MTIQDAINYFKESMAFGEGDDIRHHNEVLEFTIKTLEEKEHCEDCVSREAVKEALRNRTGESISDCINALPSVTPTRKKAKWIVLKDEYGDICEAICSCCEDNGNHRWKYCHTCGAEMESEE